MARPAQPWLRSQDDSWCVYWKGKKHNLYVKGEHNRAAAWEAFIRLRNGVPPINPATIPPPPSAPPVITVREVVEAYLTYSETRVEPGSMALYHRFLDPVIAKWGNIPADRLAATELEAFSREPKERRTRWSQTTQSKFLSTVSRAFRHGVRSKMLRYDPISDLEKPPQLSRTADVLLTPEEFGRLYSVASVQFQPFLLFMWLTGCRPGEAASLRYDDVDWTTNTITLKKHKTVNKGKVRTLYLRPEVVELLREQGQKHRYGRLFRNRVGNPWEPRAWVHAMTRLREVTGIKGKIAYSARHSFATEALAAGIPDTRVAELLGHSGTRTLMKHYAHVETKKRLLVEDAAAVPRPVPPKSPKRKYPDRVAGVESNSG